MSADEPDDKFIRERKFRRSFDISIDEFKRSESGGEGADVPEDEAIGDIFDPFSTENSDSPGVMNPDGSVDYASENDLITQFSTDGDRGINWILMVTMIVLYSAISIQVGRTFGPLSGTLVLSLLAIVGFGLGEVWVPKERMRLLGITWIIISMKILYGLAIELRHWGIIEEDVYLGLVLLLLVVVNIFVAYRHDHDAIAAQSTLVLLAIGSTAGTEFGEEGVAIMILIATILLHGIAINRNSGNLASLGIAASNLWIGMHAATSGFELGQLRILPLDTPLLLFLLLMAVSAMNAVMAARFAKEENWFSKGFKTLGLGKPGLWGVSISLGMIGAFLVVASYREDLGYALGIVTFLSGSFGGSYLVVRGVEKFRVAIPLISSGFILTMLLLLIGSEEQIFRFSSFEIFTILGASSTGFVILRDQESVSDRVLWLGSVVVLAILVLLVPDSSSGGDGGMVLLGALSILHVGTAVLAIKRNSPALSGVTVLLPWSWLLVEGFLEEGFRTVMLANEISEWEGFVELSPGPLAAYLGISSVLLLLVNVRMGSEGVNLASRFMGVSEISASLRDSGILNLWSIGLWLPMITVLFLGQFGDFTTVSIVTIFSILVAVHVLGELMGQRNSRVDVMISIIAITSLAIQWRHGLDEIMLLLLCVSLSFILFFGEDDHFGLGLTVMSAPMLISLSGVEPSNVLDTPTWFSNWSNGQSIPSVEIVAVICSTAMLFVYLPRAEKMDNMLKPAAAALILLVVTNIMTIDSGSIIARGSSVSMFVLSSFWLISRGEIRSELRTAALRDSIVASTRKFDNDESITGYESNPSSMSTYNPRIAEMAEKRKSSREKTEADDISELLTSDLSHNPLVGLFVILIALSVAVIFSAIGEGGLMLIPTGAFACVVVVMIRNRTRGLELSLPHFLGMEMPIAVSISGISLALAVGHIIPVNSSPDELLDLAVASVLILVLVIISLIHQKNLLDRIEIAIDWFVFPILSARLMASIVLGGISFPFTVDPFNGDLISFTIPWVLLESLLVLCVLLQYWVYEKKEGLGGKVIGGYGIGIRAIAVVFLSFGPAGLLASAGAALRSLSSSQPIGLGISLQSGVLAVLALTAWNSSLYAIFGEFILVLGLMMIIACAITVPLELENWTMVLATDGHILSIVGALYLGMIGGLNLPMILIFMSTVVWVVGILQLRRSLRIWGLADLIAAILCCLVFASNEIIQSDKLFLGMIILAAELGIVAWLSLENQEDLSKD